MSQPSDSLSSSRKTNHTHAAIHETLSRKTIIIAVLSVIALSTTATFLLLTTVASNSTGPDRAVAQLEAIKIGVSIGLGSGALFALYLAGRRQRSTEISVVQKERDHTDVDRAYALQEVVAKQNQEHQERVAADTKADAIERRITDLYTRAVEQLGSEKAPVRLGGLYAIERAAQDNPNQRQTIINVLCAYLRMPYSPPDPDLNQGAGPDLREERLAQLQEREVRITAQRILREHLQTGDIPEGSSDKFWEDIDLDLTGAVLIDFQLDHCTIRNAKFSYTRFDGSFATFEHSSFSGPAEFDKSTFRGMTSFEGAEFLAHASFHASKFNELTHFQDVIFAKEAVFGRSSFAKSVVFGGAIFRKNLILGSARFEGRAYFSTAKFEGQIAIGAETYFAKGRPPELSN